MIWQRLCKSFLAGLVAVAAAGSSVAGDGCSTPCAPATCKVTCVEWVPEQYQTTRTTYKTECRQETYTACRTEYRQEQRTCTKTVYKRVCETVNETRCVTCRVPVTEQKTVMKTVWKTVPETKTITVQVDRGHYENRWECVNSKPRGSFLGGLCKKKKKHDCCENSCESDCGCPKMVCKKCWVPCMQCEQRCVTCCKRVCEQVPCTVCCTTYRCETKQITCPVTRTRCVPECVTSNYTVCVPVKVPYQCTRTVKVCVPCCETVTCCRMVRKCVEKEVPVSTSCCANDCCDSHNDGCGKSRGGFFKKCFAKKRHNDCGSSGCGCSSGCGG